MDKCAISFIIFNVEYIFGLIMAILMKTLISCFVIRFNDSFMETDCITNMKKIGRITDHITKLCAVKYCLILIGTAMLISLIIVFDLRIENTVEIFNQYINCMYCSDKVRAFVRYIQQL